MHAKSSQLFSKQSVTGQRIKTGTVLVGMVSLCTLAGDYSFFLLVFIIDILALLEFYHLFTSSDVTPRRKEGVLLSVVIFICVILMHYSGYTQFFLLPLPITFFIMTAELYQRSEKPIQNLSLTLTGLIAITFPLALFLCCPFHPFIKGHYQPQMAIGYFILLWSNDSGAYLWGKKFGRHKLFERISPGKTWEGSIGGAITAFIAAGILGYYFKVLDPFDWIIITGIIVIFGTFGDLIKSMMKRSLHIKDSGHLLPGHGGMLDRFDSLLGSAPFVFSYLILRQYV